MKLEPVISSNVKGIGWERNVLKNDGFIPKDILLIEFSSGDIYEYIGVSEEVYKELMKSESKGSYINQKIRNKYQTNKIYSNLKN